MLKKVYHGFMLAITMAFLWGKPVGAAQVYDVPSNSSFKTYMDYTAITNKNSKQYKLQTLSETDSHGLRTYDGYYTVAVGTAFGVGVGDYIDVTLDTGAVLHCIVGEMKQDIHVGADRMQVSENGNVIEFIVETKKLNKSARTSGNISSIEGFEGDVVSVAVLGGTVDVSNESVKEQPKTVLDTEYLIMNKSSIVMANGETMYVVEYAFADNFNSIICSKDFYDLVSVGDVLDRLY